MEYESTLMLTGNRLTLTHPVAKQFVAIALFTMFEGVMKIIEKPTI